jgi:hypothetical protein
LLKDAFSRFCYRKKYSKPLGDNGNSIWLHNPGKMKQRTRSENNFRTANEGISVKKSIRNKGRIHQLKRVRCM